MLDPTPKPAPSSFSQHAAAVRNRVFLYAVGRGSKEEAEDLTQKAMLVLERRYSEKPEEDLFKLGGRIISLLWLDLCRKRRDHGEYTSVPATGLPLPSPDPDPLSSLLLTERAKQVARLLASLKPRCQRVIHLWMHEHTSEQIRDALALRSVNAADQAVKRCKQRLREMIKDKGTI